VISGNASLVTVSGGGLLHLGGTADNTFTGNLHVTGAGTALTLDTSVAAVSRSTAITLDSGTFLYLGGTGSGITIGGLNGAGTVSNNPAEGATPHTLSIATGAGAGLFSGVLQDGPDEFSLEIDSGSQTLSGASTYTGSTTISNANLILGATATLTTPFIEIQSGNLELDSATVAQHLTISVDGPSSSVQFHHGVSKFTVGEFSGVGTISIDDDQQQPITLMIGADNATTSFGGSFDGDGSLVKVGSGTLLLNGDSPTFTGGTSVTAGTILLGSVDALGGSTVTLVHATDLKFSPGISNFDLGGLAGKGPLVLNEASASPDMTGVTLHVGLNGHDTTYAGALSGAGAFVKIGTGTLTLTGTNTQLGGTSLVSGILQVGSDASLGMKAGSVGGAPTPAAPLDFSGGTFHATKTFSTSRGITLEPGGTATFEASAGKTLTLAGVISGSGSLDIGPTGTVLITNQGNTNTGSMELPSNGVAMVNQVTVSAPGSGGNVMITPGTDPGTIASIDLSNTTKPVTLTVKVPKGMTSATVDQIVSMDPTDKITAITLGKGVVLGDGMSDGADLMLAGKVTKLSLDQVSAGSLISIGSGLTSAQAAANHPGVTVNRILGAGVTLDLTGAGNTTTGLGGGGGLGKVVVNSWPDPGTIKTMRSIASITIKTGDYGGNILVGADSLAAGGQIVHARQGDGETRGLTPQLAVASVSNVGPISIPNGNWTGAGMAVDGIVAKILAGGLSDGTTLQAGAFGAITIKGKYEGEILSRPDAALNLKGATGAIASVAIAGDFAGVIDADGKIGNITVSDGGKFEGTLHGNSLGNITAVSFNGLLLHPSGPRQSITATGSIGNITANGPSQGDLTDYIIAAGADLGHDLLFNGVDDHYVSAVSSGKKMVPVSIGNVSINGDMSGVTIAAGVNPGTATIGGVPTYGVYGDGNDALVPLPTGVKIGTKIGALKFQLKGTPDDSFTSTLPASAVQDAIEAQVITSAQFGGAKKTGTYLSTFTTPSYIDLGSEAIILQLV
jgi:autotransporter-associated beta strand protein